MISLRLGERRDSRKGAKTQSKQIKQVRREFRLEVSTGNRKSEMIEVVNRQRGRKIKTQPWREFAESALQVIGGDESEAVIAFVSDDAIRKLNRSFRGKNYATDVLSFPSEAAPFEVENSSQLGDVVISVERAAAQAKEHGLSFSDEVKQLILHGLLHLRGYDHETDRGEMNRLEMKLRKRLKIS